ncbi:MAG: radical SAM protein [Kiritimatiellae bacterium]|nr:radical SAM protein [Kiritimatiellia bacterium]
MLTARSSPGSPAPNLYVHFPFCRSRCSYCSLYSRAGSSAAERVRYVESVGAALASAPGRPLKTVYFGGGSPALCDLAPLGGALAPLVGAETEFTVELHPLDVTRAKLDELKSIGVNRISLGVQSLDDAILEHMGRGYGFHDAERAFALAKESFDNVGIDLIVGYPGETAALSPRHARLARWGLRHCSVYSLQNERGLSGAADDDTVMNRISVVSRFLADIGLGRYEISNYAVPGFECRHNLAVWRGEDYTGVGEGACGREGLVRTRGRRCGYDAEEVSPEADRRERTMFRLRTREGLDTSGFPEWRAALDRFAAEGALSRRGDVYFLTERGTEVCDAILAEIV